MKKIRLVSNWGTILFYAAISFVLIYLSFITIRRISVPAPTQAVWFTFLLWISLVIPTLLTHAIYKEVKRIKNRDKSLIASDMHMVKYKIRHQQAAVDRLQARYDALNDEYKGVRILREVPKEAVTAAAE